MAKPPPTPISILQNWAKLGKTKKCLQKKLNLNKQARSRIFTFFEIIKSQEITTLQCIHDVYIKIFNIFKPNLLKITEEHNIFVSLIVVMVPSYYMYLLL